MKTAKEFTYYNPTKLIFGQETIKHIGKEVQKAGISSVLLIAGKGSIKTNGVYEKISASLQENNIEIIECFGVQANPTLDKANEAIALAKNKNVKAILAVGGGSVIDTAKSVAAGVYVDNIWDVYEKKIEIKKALPLFVVLTLSATASEMNSFAVLTNEAQEKKWAIGNDHLYPKVAIVDPSVQQSLPWKQTACGVIDAFTHIMEYYCLGGEQEVPLAFNESLLKTLISTGNTLQKDPLNDKARADLCWAATLALNGTSSIMLKYGDWSSHEIEHGLSAYKPDLAHAHGLAIILPAWITCVWQENKELFIRWAKHVWGVEDVLAAVAKMKEQFALWEAPISLKEIGISQADVEHLATSIMKMGSFGALKKMTKEDVVQVLELAL